VSVGLLRNKTAGLQGAVAEADRLDPHWRLDEIESDRSTPPEGQKRS